MNKKIPILCALLLALLPLAAWAGKVEFRDEAAILAPAVRQDIAARFSAFPFSARVITSTASPSRAALESRAASFLTSPDMIVVGIDPAHRYTVVRVGSGLNLEPGTFSQIAVAGNPSFKGGQWGAGIIAIGETAKGKLAISTYLRNTAPPPSFPATQVIVHQPAPPIIQSEAGSGSIGWLLAGMVATLIVICAVGIILARRRHAAKERQERQDRLDAEAERILNAERERASRRAEQVLAPARQPSSPVNPMPSRYDSAPRPATYTPPPRLIVEPAAAPIVQRYRQPPAPVVVSSSPVVVHHDHGSPADGLLTGMLLNEALHDHGHGHRRDDDSDRHVVRERVVEVERPSSSYDAGGASSGWGGSSSDSSSSFSTPASDSDSSSSSSSSYDGGGSSSSWDSGSSSSSSFDSSSDSSSSSSFDSGGGSSDF